MRSSRLLIGRVYSQAASIERETGPALAFAARIGLGIERSTRFRLRKLKPVVLVRGIMTHPITSGENKAIRDRMLKLMRKGLHRTAATNIIFVCGGDKEHHLRPKFIDYMAVELPEYLPFRPEAAQSDYFEQDHEDTLNLSQFEELISDLSLGIVLFAESPGSFAETGLFSALENARRKTLVVLDQVHQGYGSFLAFGPVATITAKSRLGAAIQMDFEHPNFGLIRDRIKDRIPVPSTRKAIGEKSFSDLDPQEIMAFIWFIVNTLRACSFEDVMFIMDGLFGAHASESRVRQILSVMVGARLLVREGPINLIRIQTTDIILVEPSKSYEAKARELAIEVIDIIEEAGDPNYLEAMAHVG